MPDQQNNYRKPIGSAGAFFIGFFSGVLVDAIFQDKATQGGIDAIIGTLFDGIGPVLGYNFADRHISKERRVLNSIAVYAGAIVGQAAYYMVK